MDDIAPKLRHPEKAHRPDNLSPRKPDWIRVKAPVSKEYHQTRELNGIPHRAHAGHRAGAPVAAHQRRVTLDLAVKAAADLFGYPGKVVLSRSIEPDYLIDNPNRRCPAIVKARSELGFDPKVPIEDGMYRSLIWYSHNRIAVAG